MREGNPPPKPTDDGQENFSDQELSAGIGIMSILGSGLGTIGSIISPIRSVGSAGASALSSTLSGMTYFLVDHILTPVDVMGVREHVCKAPEPSEDEATTRSPFESSEIQGRAMVAKAISKGIADAFGLDDEQNEL